MTINVDDEILQDFLLEGGEILEQLGAQLVELEQRPGDYDLLNAVFRGFHTIKGGAGFLNIESLVEICHRAEDVFNVLRQGQRAVDADLMDAVLQVVDLVNEMFERLRSGEAPEPAERALLTRLGTLTQPLDDVSSVQKGELHHDRESAQHGVPEAPEEPPPSSDSTEPDLVTRQMDAFLESAQASMTATEGGESDEISADEFEALLDQLHGTTPSRDSEPVDTSSSSATAEMSEGEFEALLDQLHGQGRHGGMPVSVPDNVPSVTKEAGLVGSASAPTTQTTPQPSAHEVPKEHPSRSPVGHGLGSSTAEATVRVDTQRLDEIMNMVGELVLVRNRLATLKATSDDEALANAVANLDVVTSDLQVAVMKTRMQPIKKVFSRFPRVVRDLARNLHKEVDLELRGEETDLDKNLVEALADPLVHLVRNAVDHGIEMPAAREKAGKPRRGRVVLSAAQEGDHILLSIQDDGRGMDPEALRQKAVEKGMVDLDVAARLDKKDLFNLIFAPGFSTKSEISDVSGRGVGMDVVKTRIVQMNGQVEIDSQLGAGSTIIIKLPLTLAIMPTLMVVLGKQPFALPLASVVEIFNLDLTRTNTVDGQLTVRVRGHALPLFYLRQWLVSALDENYNSYNHQGHVVVVAVGNIQVGLVVDHLIGQEEVVIKPLGALLQGLQGMAGATITGDGKIALILDVPGLMHKYARPY